MSEEMQGFKLKIVSDDETIDGKFSVFKTEEEANNKIEVIKKYYRELLNQDLDFELVVEPMTAESSVSVPSA